MAEYKLVSIVVPCFNYGKFLPKALDSLLAQTHKNIEIIVINDGSTDQTDQVAENYSNKHKNIKHIKRPNSGIIKTRNLGIKLSKGDYIIQLDADDWLDSDYVEKALALSINSGADIVYSHVAVFERINKINKFPKHNLETLKYQNYIHASSLIKSAVAKKFKYDPNLEGIGYEDWDFFLQACLEGSEAKLLVGPMLHYRKHSSQQSRSDVTSRQRKDIDARIYILEKYINKYPDKMQGSVQILATWKRIRNDLEKIRDANQQLKADNDIQQKRIAELEKEIEEMKRSKFWKARESYVKLRKSIGLS